MNQPVRCQLGHVTYREVTTNVPDFLRSGTLNFPGVLKLAPLFEIDADTGVESFDLFYAIGSQPTAVTRFNSERVAFIYGLTVSLTKIERDAAGRPVAVFLSFP